MRGTVGALLCAAGTRLHAEGIPRREARLLLAHALSVTPEALLRDAHAAVAPDAAARFEALLARRLSHEPMALILGHAGFWTLELEVSGDTLIPRADSEAVIELALRLARADAPRLLDLGTGTGCLLLALLTEWPRAQGVGLDSIPALPRSPHATPPAMAWPDAPASSLAIGPGHCRRASTSSSPTRPISRASPSRASCPKWRATSRLPPWRRRRRAGCLSCHPAELPRLLAPGGHAILELGMGQGPAVARLAAPWGLEVRGMQADLNGRDRAMALGRAIGGARETS
jgi:release factor glutamine methyltransferase